MNNTATEAMESLSKMSPRHQRRRPPRQESLSPSPSDMKESLSSSLSQSQSQQNKAESHRKNAWYRLKNSLSACLPLTTAHYTALTGICITIIISAHTHHIFQRITTCIIIISAHHRTHFIMHIITLIVETRMIIKLMIMLSSCSWSCFIWKSSTRWTNERTCLHCQVWWSLQ